MISKNNDFFEPRSHLAFSRHRNKYLLRDLAIAAIFLSIMSSFARAGDPTAYVINTLGETLSKVNLKTDQVRNDVLTLGSAPACGPNQIVIRDSLAYVVNSLTSEIQIIDLTSESTAGYIDMGQGRNPFWMAFSDADTQYAWVTCSAVDSLFKVDVRNKSLVAGYPVGVWPQGILILSGLAYVCITALDINDYTYGQGEVVVFDTRTNSIAKKLKVGINPQYITLDNQGEIYVSCTGDFWSTWGVIYAIDPALNVIKDSILIGGSPCQMAVSADGLGWVAAGGWDREGLIYLFDSRSDTTIFGSENPILVPDDPGIMGVVTLPDSTALACAFQVDELVKIDTASGSVLKRYQVGDGPAHLAVSHVEISSDLTSDVESGTPIRRLALFQNYPNPFNSTTLIRFGLSSRCQVKIEIFNVLGQRIKTLIDEKLGPGLREVSWDGKDNRGQRLTSGIYFYKMKTREVSQSRKMLLLK